MNITTPTTRATAINAKCRGCIVDPLAAGTWREQVACCVSADCALFAFRPLPRQCVSNGAHDRDAINTVRNRLERAR